MKKIFTLMAAALLGMSAYAQEMEEDVTSYIKNAGFDEDITWNADGSPKEIVDKSENLSGRSQAWVAADNSVYCSALTSGSGNNWKRTDIDFSWNGFIGQVAGWTLESNKATSAPYKASSPEWVYFGTLPYDLGPTAVPIADDNNGSFLRVPATKPEGDNGDDNKAAVYLRAGWGGSAAYKQTIDLPCAQYRLDYWVYNDNYNNSKNNTKVKNLCKVTCRKDVFEDSLGFAAQTWEKHSIEFTPTANFTIQFGFTSDGSSNNNPFLFIDGIRLYKIGEADAEELLKADLSEYIDSLNNLIEVEFADYEGFANELSDKAMEFQEALDDNDQDVMKAALLNIQAYLGEVNGHLANIETFLALLSSAEALITKTEGNPYPGIDAFMEKFDAFNEYIDGGFTPEEGTAAEYLAKQTEALQAAINDYKFSQEATPDNPADYTFLIQNPEFIKAEAEPTYDELGNATYPNVDSYTAGSAPADAVSTGWYTGEGGGDQRLNYVQGRVCWNAWRSGAAAPISISQDLEGLPNGVYSVSAYLITQAGYITDQHVFANGTIQSGNSPVLSKDTWADDNTGEWDFLTTEKVIVSDGKLTIGAMGNLSGEAAAGWFCVTHFVLNYYGAATEEDVINLYNTRINDFTTYAEGMGFKADKKAFEEVVKANSGLTDYNEIQSALAVLNEAYATAQKSQSEYDGVLAGTYNDLKTNIAETYPEQTKLVAQKIVDIETQYLESDTASYVYSTLKTPILRYYRDNLLPALQNAESKAYTDAIAQQAIAKTINSVVSALTAINDFPTTDELAVYVEQLNNAIALCDAAERIHVNGINAGDDYTFAINHPTVDDSNATGWTVTRTNGDANAKTGQEYDGGSGYYMDSWNPTAGLLLYTAQQTIENIPNGIYEVKAMVRTSSNDGYYLFAQDEPSLGGRALVKATEGEAAAPKFAHVVLESFNYTKYMDPLAVAAEGGDSIASVSDQHGSIWEVAMDELMAATGINKPITLDDGTPYSIAEQISEKYAADVNEVPDELKEAFLIMSANSNLGRGWQYKTLQFEVTNHAATIGVTCDSTFTAGYKDVDGADCTPFTGTWISADNFTLTLVTPGDNEEWSPIVTGIEEVNNYQLTINNELYNLQGVRVNDSYKGIVIRNGKKMLRK